jgi:hypothetical protein
MHAIMKQKNPLDRKPLRLLQITGCSSDFNISDVLTLSDPPTKMITACCSTTVQVKTSATIFKDDLQTNTTLTKPNTDLSRQCLVCG